MKRIEKIAQIIRKSKRFLITSHLNLEGDSLGSQLAMANLLKFLGKDFVILDNDRVPAHYQFLPHVDMVKNRIGRRGAKFDAAIVLDCPNLGRTGRVKNAVEKAGLVINIDHHVSNEEFGDLNWIDKEASSVGEMIYKLYKAMNCEITKETALYLYIAILTDTGSFNYSNTSSATHEIVSELLGHGIEPYPISKSIYENKALGDLRLLGRTLAGLELAARGKVALMAVRKKDFRETKTAPVSCENFVNFARSIKGVDVAIFFREDLKKKNAYHVSFRSAGRVDVNKIASSFGGGGHKQASGCALRGSFAGVKKKILGKVNDAL